MSDLSASIPSWINYHIPLSLSKQYYMNDRRSVFQQHKLLLPRFRWSLSGMESLARQMVWHLARPSSLSRFASMLSIHLIMQSETEWEKARVRGRGRESEVRATQTVIDWGGRDTEMMFIWSMTQTGRISWHIESLQGRTSKLCVSSVWMNQQIFRLVKNWAIEILNTLYENQIRWFWNIRDESDLKQ